MNARISTVSRYLLVAAIVCQPTLAMAQSQAWDKKIDGAARFKILDEFNKEAVLDKETGLVWERTPDPGPGSWPFIDDECLARFTGGRLGWRPPTAEEVLSLMDPLQNLTGKLPVGHPFDFGEDRITPRQFWTMTSAAVQPPNNDFAYVANFEPGGSLFADIKISELHHFWCVRGGHGYDGNNVP